MRIDPNSPYLDPNASQGVGNLSGQAKVTTPQSTAGAGQEPAESLSVDTVQLSGTLSEAQQLKAELGQTPEVRAERVAALQEQVAQGTYQPSSEAIAQAMPADLFGAGPSR